jgi:hypothetical protein
MLLWCLIALMVIALCLFCFFTLVASDDAEAAPRNRETVQFTLPSGEIVSNDTWIQDETRENNLTFRETASSPPQSLDTGLQLDIDSWPWSEIQLNAARLFKFPDHRILIIEPYIFVFAHRLTGSSWSETRMLADTATSDYLQIFTKPGDPDYPRSPGQPIIYSDGSPSYLVKKNYHFDHLNGDGRTLFFKRTADGDPYPQWLAYSLSFVPSSIWGLQFDFDATVKANRFSPPKDPGLMIDASVVQYPGKFSADPTLKKQDLLAKPGATETPVQSFPLSATDWTSVQGDFPKTTMQIRFGFWSLSPGYVSVLVKGDNDFDDPDRHLKLGEWQRQFGLRRDNVIFEIFYRMRQR